MFFKNDDLMSDQGRIPEWRKRHVQRRVDAAVDHLRPQRWNWTAVVTPLDRTISRQAGEGLTTERLRGLRFFWLDGLFAAISDNFYISFVPLFALAFGATNGQIGVITAVGNMLGALAFIPGARLVEKVGKRNPVVIWTGGTVMRLTLLAFALFPFFVQQPQVAIVLIVILEGIRSFAGNLGNPAWTALVADLVPDNLRGRYFGGRNFAMGIAALLVAPLAGRMISSGNEMTSSRCFRLPAGFLSGLRLRHGQHVFVLPYWRTAVARPHFSAARTGRHVARCQKLARIPGPGHQRICLEYGIAVGCAILQCVPGQRTGCHGGDDRHSGRDRKLQCPFGPTVLLVTHWTARVLSG